MRVTRFNSRRTSFIRLNRKLVLGVFLLGLNACVAQPLDPSAAAADTVVATTHSPPVVRNGRHTLSKAQAKPVLAALEKEGDTDLLHRHLRSARADIASPLVTGNSAHLLIDGPAAYKSMFQAIDQARDNIDLESYIIADDEAGARLRAALLKKRAQGIVVNVMYDSVGSLGTPKEYFEDLHRHGVSICEFNPVNPLKAKDDWTLNHRNHRKILVVDGRVAFTGGINISGVYSAGSAGSRRKSPDDGWRDTQVRISGPIVAEAQKLFLDAWGSEGCPVLPKADYFPQLAPTGSLVMRLIAGTPEHGNQMYPTLLSAIDQAEASVHLTYGYFVPDPKTIDTLERAARRGVDVSLILPSFSDFWAPLYAGRSHYTELLEAGVKIYERQDALLHAKTGVIDSVWSTVGSTNLDWRSFVLNDEADVIVFDAGFGGEMESLFAMDVGQSRQIELAQWRRRGFGTRMKEWLARRWAYFL
jgi:cardiolipin synthase